MRCGLAAAAAAFGAIFAAPALADVMPLKRGIYVANAPCEAGSMATISAFDGKTFMDGPARCVLTNVKQTGSRYATKRICTSERNGERMVQNVEYTVTGPDSYVLKTEYGTFSAKYCERSRLPPPWRR